MTANELIEIVESENHNPFLEEISDMLRQQAQEIADLKISNQDLKYQLIQKANEQVLNDFKELIDEDDDIFRKEQVEKFYAEARPLREKYKLCELTDEEIIEEIKNIYGKKFDFVGYEEEMQLCRNVLKKASKK